MLSELQVKRVWEGMLGSETRAYYFAELSGVYRKRQLCATWGTLTFATADAVSFFLALPAEFHWIRAVLAVCAASTSIYLALAENEKKAYDSSDLFVRWSRLERGYQAIWEDVYSDGALARLDELDEQALEMSKTAINLARKPKAMKKWQDHTEKQHQVGATA